MEIPCELQNFLLQKVENVSTRYLNEIFKNLSDDYIKNSGNGKEFIKNRDYALVYALSRMNATFSVVDFVLEMFEKYVGEEIHTLLDVGAGMGTASINSLYHFDLQQIDLIERNRYMAELGKELLSFYEYTRFTYHEQDIINTEITNKYDMVIASYFLSEQDIKSREKTLKKLWNATEKYLIICDTGTPEGYRNMMQIKEMMISYDAKVVLPCPTNNCPIENDWCHFVTRVNRFRINKLVKNADVPYEDEKFCYIIFARNVANKVRNMVIRHPYKEKSKVSLKLCEDGKISEKTITKNSPLYKRARKVRVGEEL